MDPMIRPARADDLGAIESIVREAYGHYRARLGKEPGPMLDDYRAHIGGDVSTSSKRTDCFTVSWF
jgi:hypothetical protein